MDEMTAANEPLSWPVWIGGFFLTLVVGCFLNIFSGAFGLATESKLGSVLCGIIPGVLFALLAFFLRKRARSFALGIVTAACVVALVGGICSVSLVGQSFAG